MYRLRLLGGASLEGPDGPLSGRVVQRRQLALLALLAADPARGLSRSKLVGHLWPERSESRARHLLSDTLYVVRRALGSETVRARAAEELRLNPRLVWSDVREFRRGVGAEDREQRLEAVALYRGPFLDGFDASTSRRFEEWVSRTRRRLKDAFAGLLERLADEARTAAEWQHAIRWWKRRLALDPYHSRIVCELMRTEARAGNPAKALRHAEAYRARITGELNLPPAAAVLELAERIRSESPAPTTSPAVPDRPEASRSSVSDRGPIETGGSEVRVEEEPDRRLESGSGRRSAPRGRRIGIGVGAVAMLVVFAVLAFVVGPDAAGRGPEIRSLVVLPLEDLSGGSDQAYLADGMRDALSHQLSRIEGLRVISRTSALAFGNTEERPPEIARKLGVDALIVGSVLHAGDEVRMSLELVDGPTDRSLWSATYERELEDVHALQRGVAREIAAEIEKTLDPAEGAPPVDARPVDPEAYRLYLKGNFQLERYGEEAFRQALRLYRDAIDVDPDYAPAYAGLALAYAELGSWPASFSPLAVYPEAKAAALQALARDSTLAEAHIALGRIRHLFEWDWSGAETAFRRGIALDPSATYARIVYTNCLVSMGRFEEAVEFGRETVERDPLAPIGRTELGWALENLGGHDEEALDLYREALELRPSWFVPHVRLADLHLQRGEYVKALEHARDAEGLPSLSRSPAWLMHVGYVYARAGRRPEALRILHELEARAETEYVAPNVLAALHLVLGDEERALELYERGYRVRDVTWHWLGVHRHVDRLRDEPRFEEMLARMDFPTE